MDDGWNGAWAAKRFLGRFVGEFVSVHPRNGCTKMLSPGEGRTRFGASSAPRRNGAVHFSFPTRTTHRGRVLEKEPPTCFALEYFGGSRVQFDLVPDGEGGTDLTMTESAVPAAHHAIHLPGWIPDLLALKAALDFSVDPRNHAEHRT